MEKVKLVPQKITDKTKFAYMECKDCGWDGTIDDFVEIDEIIYCPECEGHDVNSY